MNTNSNPDFADTIQNDIDLIGRLTIVPSLLNIICKTTGMGFAAIARVTDKKWIACAVKDDISFGLQVGGELSLETTLCNEIRIDQKTIVIDHVDKDEMYANHHTPRMYGFQSYISVPIRRKDNSFFGTLCAIDPSPHRLNTPETIAMFVLYADLISFHLQALEQVSVAEEKLSLEQKTHEVRDQFIAILGHDLRNPLSSISMTAELLKESSLQKTDGELIDIIARSAHRMTGLINNILDFAKARLGNGIPLNRSFDEPLQQILHQVILENRVSRPNRIIESNINIPVAVYCDSNRLAELFSNLLGNALEYGDRDKPVVVETSSSDHSFMLSVKNYGHPISPQTMSQLFRPFVRGSAKHDNQGLGLGLFISSEIAKSHGGTIEVHSSKDETTFILKIPLVSQKISATGKIRSSDDQLMLSQV